MEKLQNLSRDGARRAKPNRRTLVGPADAHVVLGFREPGGVFALALARKGPQALRTLSDPGLPISESDNRWYEDVGVAA